MLHEPASSSDYQPPALKRAIYEEPSDERPKWIEPLVSEVLEIERSARVQPHSAIATEDKALLFNSASEYIISYQGTLKMESEEAFNQLDEALKPHDMYCFLREFHDEMRGRTTHVVHVLYRRPNPSQPRPFWNIALFIATFVSVLLTGLDMALQDIGLQNPLLAEQLARNPWAELWRGIPYAFSIMLILGAHEMGHFFAARRHQVVVSLPYFIPVPLISPFGTFGAFISLRQPMRNRKVLFDIGAAGPLAGLVFAIPILIIGVATSPVREVTGPALVEGNSILYAFTKFIIHGRFLPSGGEDIFVNQLLWAGWTGLLVTGLNLIPLGQLDGGHILYSLLGNRARKLYVPLLIAGLGLVMISNVWILFVILLFLFGRFYAVPLDDVTPLDSRRKMLAYATLVIFALIFVPIPLAPNDYAPLEGASLLQGGALPLGVLIVTAFSLLRARLR